MHIHTLARLLIVADEHILLTKCQLKDGTDFFFLPGGHIEYHETMDEAARRELREELGITPERIQSITPLGVYEHAWDNSGTPYHEIGFVSACQITGLTPDTPVPSPEKHITFEWHPLADLGRIHFLPKHLADILPRWLAKPVAPEAFFSSVFLTKQA